MNKNGHGGVRPGSGRKPKEISDEILARLKPMDELFYSALKNGLQEREPNAVKLFAYYRFGMPIQTVNNNVSGEMTVNWKEEKTYAHAFPLSEINN